VSIIEIGENVKIVKEITFASMTSKKICVKYVVAILYVNMEETNIIVFNVEQVGANMEEANINVKIVKWDIANMMFWSPVVSSAGEVLFANIEYGEVNVSFVI